MASVVQEHEAIETKLDLGQHYEDTESDEKLRYLVPRLRKA